MASFTGWCLGHCDLGASLSPDDGPVIMHEKKTGLHLHWGRSIPGVESQKPLVAQAAELHITCVTCCWPEEATRGGEMDSIA